MKNFVIGMATLTLLLPIGSSAEAAGFFADGFESGDDSHVENGAQWTGTAGDVSVTTNDKRTGSYSMRFRYGAGISNVEQRFGLGAQRDGVYIRYYVKFPTNYVHGLANPSNNKLIRLWSEEAAYGSDGIKIGMSLVRAGTYSTVYPEAKIVYASGWQLQCDGAMGSISSLPGMGTWSLGAEHLGQWLAFEFHFRRDTGSGDGAFEFWVDGVRQFGSTTLAFNGAPCQNPYFLTGYLFGWANASFAEATDIYIDDVVFSDSYIGPDGSHTPSPPSTLRAPGQP